MPTFTADKLRKFSIDIFEGVGVPYTEAEIVSDHLVDASLAGLDSHGVLRIPQYVNAIQVERKIVPGAKLEIVRDTTSGLLINGNFGFGQVIAHQAMELAIQKARETAISAVSVYNCFHTGRLGSYTAMAADEGLIGMMMVNAGGCGQWVAPFGGIAKRIGTNPISIGVPTGTGDPIVVDFATSTAPEGKIRALHNRGAEVPEGFIIDHQGQPATNAADFYGPPAGALLPLGGALGYKGFGLGLIVDIMAGGISGIGCCRPGAPQEPDSDGVFMIAIDIGQFTPLEEFYPRVTQLIEHVKSSPPVPGFSEVLVPGEPESRQKKHRTEHGIAIDNTTWSQIQEIADGLGVASPSPLSNQ
jgi:uncharacterized oxidoreductase